MTMRIEADIKLGFKDVLFRPKRSTLKSRSQVSLERTFRFVHTNTEWTRCSCYCRQYGYCRYILHGSGTGGVQNAHRCAQSITLLKSGKAFSIMPPAGIEEHVMVSSGTSESDFERMSEILRLNDKLRFICIDVANGYSEHFVQYVARVRQQHPEKVIVAGNVVTGEMVEELILKGADVVKVGIGPGSVCTTRVKNRCWLSAALSGDRVRRCGAWRGRSGDI